MQVCPIIYYYCEMGDSMLNIQMQLCGLLNVVLLAIFYYSAPRLKMYKQQLFSNILWVTIINLSFDIMSVFAIHYRAELPENLVYFICKAYLCMIVVEVGVAISYVTADILNEMRHRSLRIIVNATVVAACGLIAVNPISIYEMGNAVYTYNTAVEIVYCYAGISILLIILSTFVFASRMNPRRLFGVRVWMGSWVVAMMLQGINNEWLVVGFASSIGIMVLFICLENPELQIDTTYLCFNSVALKSYIKSKLENDVEFCAANFSLANVRLLKTNAVNYGQLQRTAAKIMKNNPNIAVFNNMDMNLVAIGQDMNELRAIVNEYIREFSPLAQTKMETVISILPKGNLVYTPEDMMLLFIDCQRKKAAVNTNNVIVITDKDVVDYHHTEKIRMEITDALAEDRVEVFLQPIYNISQQMFTTAEALMRIRLRDGSLLSPGVFIPVAEASGQIVELGHRILEKTCQFLADGRAKAMGLMFIDVNLSIIQCEMPDICDQVEALIKKYGISPEQISMEITESASIKTKKLILQNMERFLDMGITFVLDDFGKGESNLMYVVDMPFKSLKLDMDMTKAYHRNEKARNVLKAVEGMAHAMDLRLVAEGIETEEEFNSMKDCGIDYIQGYYFSRPLPTESFIDFLREHN